MILIAPPCMTFLWAAIFALFARVAGADDGVQAASGLIAIAACLIITEVLP